MNSNFFFDIFKVILRGEFRNLPHIYDGTFLYGLAVNYLCKKSPPWLFNRDINTLLLPFYRKTLINSPSKYGMPKYLIF